MPFEGFSFTSPHFTRRELQRDSALINGRGKKAGERKKHLGSEVGGLVFAEDYTQEIGDTGSPTERVRPRAISFKCSLTVLCTLSKIHKLPVCVCVHWESCEMGACVGLMYRFVCLMCGERIFRLIK